MNQAEEYLHKNYLMAAGRIGLGIIMIPLLWGLAALFYFDNSENLIVSIVLFCLGIPLLWYGFTVPTSIRIGEKIKIGYPFGSRTYEKPEVKSIDHQLIGTRFTMQHFIRSEDAPTKRIPMAVLTLSNGWKVKARASFQEVQELRKHYEAIDEGRDTI